MLIKLGGNASYEDLESVLWKKWCKVLTVPERDIYEFLVSAYDEGLEEVDVNVLVKHLQMTKALLWKSLEHLDKYGLIDRAQIDN